MVSALGPVSRIEHEGPSGELEGSKGIMEQGGGNLEVGQPVFIRLTEAESKKEHPAKVAEISAGKIRLAISESDDELQVEKEARLRIRSWDQKAIYYCEADITKVSKNKKDLWVSEPEAAATLQRRGRIRHEVKIPFSFSVLVAGHSQLVTQKEHSAITEDLSLGGLSFGTDLPLMEGDQILVTLPTLPEKVTAGGTVVRAQRGAGGPRLILISAELRLLSPEEQDGIVELVEEQANLEKEVDEG
jgi:hypothetical protein